MTFITFGEEYPNTEYQLIRCNMCGKEFSEEEILIEEGTDKEYCPICFSTGYLMTIDEEKE